MTIQEKISFLRQYRYAERQAQRICDEIQEWRTRAEKITPALRDMPSRVGDGTAPFVRPVERIAELENRLSRQVEVIALLRDTIDKAISAVPDPRYRELLELRYIRGLTWEQIAVEMNYDYRHVTKLHGYALSAIIL